MPSCLVVSEVQTARARGTHRSPGDAHRQRTRTFVNDRRGGEVDVDDAFEAFVEFEQGAIGTLEASRFAVGRVHSAQHGTREAVTYRAGRATVAEPG
jgi:predicted dehydrogenase